MKTNRIVVLALGALLVIGSSGCGTLIYPERRGQTGGRIDPAIAILDGVGLLVFLVPGIVAYAVDFATGAIYLPDAQAAADGSPKMRVVQVPAAALTPRRVREVVAAHTGVDVDPAAPGVEVRTVDDSQGLAALLAAAR